ncbi:hypothetical protein SAMN06265376_10743 [Dokdonia pacifica]|uniref:Uncharacterized protein n=1 Tax=Dokdonia pacifica TaxID=1627892 RepID=A0A239BZL4_9FLAO|nr:hypothetical protein SAMN06265376_10743 [Dokdonia pacifica]
MKTDMILNGNKKARDENHGLFYFFGYYLY